MYRAERHEPIAIPPAGPAPGPCALLRATECSWIRSRPRPASPALANKSVPHGCNRAAVSLAPSESVPLGTRAVSPPRAVRWALQRPAHPTFTPSRATSDPAQRVSACRERPSDLPASRAFVPRSAKRPPPRHSVRPGTDPDPGPRLRHWGLRHWPTRRARGGKAQWRRSETSFPNRLAAARSRAWRRWRRGDYCPAAKRCGPSGLRTFGPTTRSQSRVEVSSAATRPKRGSDERTRRAVPSRAIALRSRSERSVSDMASGRGPGRRADAVTAVTRPAAT